MSMQDPISDMLTRIRNALSVGQKKVTMSTSLQKQALAKILKEEGYILDYSLTEALPASELAITLKYHQGKSVISGIKRISRPGLRVYKGYQEIPKTSGGFGISIVSTSLGVVCDRIARQHKVGGEVWCQVW